MGKSIKLNILSPGRETITEEILSLSTYDESTKTYHLSNESTGIIYIKDNIINLCCDSVNLLEEIDLERARRALERAEERLSQKECNIDIERAKILRTEISKA